ncbi:MAG TPA: DedA family protein [Acidimicrobiales bacterium]|nr:DedA family protein [Acidimicrobiales bacterium]
MEHFLEHWGYTAIFFVALVEAICIPFPSEITYGFTAALAAQHKYGFSVVAVVVLAVVGEVVGCVIAYVIGKSGGRTVIDRWGKYVLLTHKDLDRADRFMARRGTLAVFFGRFIPLVRAVISLVAGIGEMPFRRFLASTAAATAIYGVVLGIVGYQLGASWHKIVKGFTDAGFVALALVVVIVAAGIVHRVRTMRAEGASAAPSERNG